MRDIIKTGTVEGTGAAIDIEVGWVPKIVELINIDGDAMLFWDDQMADAAGYKIIAAGTNALISTGGITPIDGDTDTIPGFTIGADTDVNANGETINWRAYRCV